MTHAYCVSLDIFLCLLRKVWTKPQCIFYKGIKPDTVDLYCKPSYVQKHVVNPLTVVNELMYIGGYYI